MKKFIVTIPLAGSIRVEVEAKSMHEAKAAAFEKVEQLGPEAGRVTVQPMDMVVQNFAPLNEITAREVKRGKR